MKGRKEGQAAGWHMRARAFAGMRDVQAWGEGFSLIDHLATAAWAAPAVATSAAAAASFCFLATGATSSPLA